MVDHESTTNQCLSLDLFSAPVPSLHGGYFLISYERLIRNETCSGPPQMHTKPSLSYVECLNWR